MADILTVEQVELDQKKKEQEFWDKWRWYYNNHHPLLPPVKRHWRMVMRLAKKFLTPESVVLDLCCGTGRFETELVGQELPFKQVVGIDFAPGMLALAGKGIASRRVRFVNADVSERLDFPTESQDLVVFNWGPSNFDRRVLEEVVFPEIHRILKIGGHFIIASVIRGKKLSGIMKKITSLHKIISLARSGIIKQATQFEKEMWQIYPGYSIAELRGMILNAGIGMSIREEKKTICGSSITFVGQKGA